MGKYWWIDIADCCFWGVEGKTLKGKTPAWKLYHTLVLDGAATYCVGPRITRTVMESFCLASNKACSAGRKGGISYRQPLGQGKYIGGETRLKKNKSERTGSRMSRCQARRQKGKKPLKVGVWVAVLDCHRSTGLSTWWWRWLVAAPLKAA